MSLGPYKPYIPPPISFPFAVGPSTVPFTGNETSTEEFIVAFTEYQTSVKRATSWWIFSATMFGFACGLAWGIFVVCPKLHPSTKSPVNQSVPASSTTTGAAFLQRHISAGCVACQNMR